MIKLIFTTGRETITIEVEGKIIVYRDRKFPQGIKVIPKDENFERIVLLSRNRIPKEIIILVRDANTGKNLKEYQDANDDEDLVTIVKRDAKLKGCIFQKRINL